MVCGQGELFGHFQGNRRSNLTITYVRIQPELILPGQLAVFDIFLFDSDFKIERPARYYRRGLHLLGDSSDDDDEKVDMGKGKGVDRSARQQQAKNTDSGHFTPTGNANRISTMGTIRSKMLKVFKRKQAPEPEVPPRSSGSGSGGPLRVPTDDTASTVSTASLRSERDPPEKRNLDEVSNYTFYIKNSQMKLKIDSKSERRMLQCIAALEKAAPTCHFTRRSRFDSFAPIRLNVATQWLVDGVKRFPPFTLPQNSCILFTTSAIIFGTFLVLYCSRKSQFISTVGGYLRVSQPACCSQVYF